MEEKDKIKTNRSPQNYIYFAGIAAGEICQKVLSSENYHKLFSTDFFRYQMHDIFYAAGFTHITTEVLEKLVNKFSNNPKENFIGKYAKHISTLLNTTACYSYEWVQSVGRKVDIDYKDLAAMGVGISMYHLIDNYYKNKNEKTWQNKVDNSSNNESGFPLSR